MKKSTDLLLALALPAAFSVTGEALAACDNLSDNAVDGFACDPAGPVAVGAVFSTSASDARRNLSLALVNEMKGEDEEDEGGAGGDGMPIDLFATLVYGDKDYETRSVPGFDSDTWGGVLGVNYRGPDYRVGVALDYSEEEADFKEGAGSQDTDEWGFQLFGLYTPTTVKGLFLTASARYSSLDIDTTRTFFTAQSENTDEQNRLNQASGSTDGSTFGLLGGAGYSWPLQSNTFLDLSAWLSWKDYKIDGYQESGAALQGNNGQTFTGNLLFDDDDYSTLDGILTAEIRHSIPITNGFLTPSAAVSYVHEFESDTRTINAVLVDVIETSAENGTISFRTNEPDRNYFRLGASLSADFTSGTSVYLTYSGMVGHDWRNESLWMLGLNQAF
jgi:uncharacterized protein YhjY with autotransporter beta-barrel domain